MDGSQARGKVLDALFFAASLRGPGEFVTAAELAAEAGLSAEELDACAQALLAAGHVQRGGAGALQITKAGIAALRTAGP